MSEYVNGRSGRPVGEQSTAELLQHAGEQLSRLVRDEIALARAELVAKGRHAGRSAGLFGGGALVALYGVGALVLAAVLGLAEAVPMWLAALIVGAALLLLAGGMVMLGRRQMRQALPPMPESTTSSLRADVDAVTTAVKERGSAGRTPDGPAAVPSSAVMAEPAGAVPDRGRS